MATRLTFTEADLEIDEALGHPKAYAKLCRDPHLNPYSHGPPFTFLPYVLPSQEVSRARELDDLFPIIDLEAKPSAKPKIYANILWKQLNHLGNAGFDPAQFRVDPYGNVLYYHADSASPLAWEIDHWFPCSRGGRTVPSNLRLLQWQVHKKKHNKLEFLVPWWDLQLGVSVNQFLSMFASSNSDFRSRAFSLLFFEGETEELNSSQTVDSLSFPQHFIESKKKVGLAPAAIVSARKESLDSSSTLRSIDLNRRLRASSPAPGGRKSSGDTKESPCKLVHTFRPSISKENDDPDKGVNPYLTIAMARDSLRKEEEMQAEIQKLDEELDALKHNNEEERVALQDLELVLVKRRRRAEKSRRLAEAQSSYKALLEKMIRDAMHQSVIYKEQLRLNQAATSALMARLEAQKAICDSSERELHRKFKTRDEIESQIKPHWGEQARKRSRMNDTLFEEGIDRNLLLLPETKQWKPIHKELRVFLEEEHNASEVGISPKEDQQEGELRNTVSERLNEYNKSLIVVKNDMPIEDRLKKLEIEEVKSPVDLVVRSPEGMEDEDRMRERRKGNVEKWRMKSPDGLVVRSPEIGEDEDCRKERGKGNVEKWLQMLLEDSSEAFPVELPHQNAKEDEKTRTEEIIEKLKLKNPQKEIKILKFPETDENMSFKQVEPRDLQAKDGEKRRDQVTEMEGSKRFSGKGLVDNDIGKGISNPTKEVGNGNGSSKRFEGKDRKERGLVRSESARAFKPIPYSPSVILGMKKGVDCIGKKPMVIGSDEDGDEENHVPVNNFIKSSINTIKKAVKK